MLQDCLFKLCGYIITPHSVCSCEDQPSRNKSTLYKWCFSLQFIGNVRVRGEFLQVEASDFLRYNGHSSGVLGAFSFSALLLEYLRIYLILIDNLPS